MKAVLALLLILSLAGVFATCSDGQIDVNTASVEELDLLYGVGPAKAQAIIDARPYNSIDELVNANGIGDATLQKIKDEGLACVDEENSVTTTNNENEELTKTEDEPKTETKVITFQVKEEKNPVTGNVVSLNPKDIKTEDTSLNNKTDYGKYLLIAFGVILVGLFFIKPRKRKNEWRK